MTDFSPKNSGIMFQPDMVRAYVKRSKNQTRRVKGLQVINEIPNDWQLIFLPQHQGIRFVSFEHKETRQVIHLNMPYGGKGDTLYFKETYRMWSESEYGEGFIHYRADDAKVSPTWWTEEDWKKVHSGWFEKWNSSMFMPRRFSRFRHVPILNVRVERLQDITAADCVWEGVGEWMNKDANVREWMKEQRRLYFNLWDSINGKTLPASKNPYVWVYDFPPNEV